MKTKSMRFRTGEPEAAPETRRAGHEAFQTGSKEGKKRQRLPASLERFILHCKIDTHSKISFLLFLHLKSQEEQINRDYVRKVTLTDAPILDELNEELCDAALLTSTGGALSLGDAPEVRSAPDTMAHVFEDPTGRQEPLRRLYRLAAVPL